MLAVVFTDLDGTLLDHDGYSFEAARPALSRLRKLEIPIVLVTSKTRAEVEVLRRRLELDEPFVTENGGGIFFPPRHRAERLPRAVMIDGLTAVVLGRSYGEARSFIDARRDSLTIEGFGDMTPERISELTGLSLDEAVAASRREFTEPFLLRPETDLDRLREEAADEGFAITTGGRFHHLIGARQDKGRAVEVVARFFSSQRDGEIVTIGLGDSPNDLPMLETVDLPVVVPRSSGPALEISSPAAVFARQPGSRGWNESVMRLLTAIYSNES